MASYIRCFDQYGNLVTNLTQWDSNVILTFKNYKYNTAPVVHFAFPGDESSKTVHGTLENNVASVVVPNIFLTTAGKELNVFVFQYDNVTDDGHAIYHIQLPVVAKPKPDDYEYVDNTDIIEISTLGIRLAALVAEAEATINTKIGELETAYNQQVQGIKDDIASDVQNLNQSITDNNDALHTAILSSRSALERDITNALQTMLASVSDGSPRGIFSDAAELSGKPAGFYLYTNPESANDGYVYWWDGIETTVRLVYYAGIVVNDRTITYDMLTDALKHEAVETVVSYTLAAEDWFGDTQELDVSDDYTVTSKTKADVGFDSDTYTQLVMDGCGGIGINNIDNTLVAHALCHVPSDDVTIQITLREVK